MIPFVVLARSRSGSTHLVELLNGHPQVVCNREILSPDHDDWSLRRQAWPRQPWAEEYGAASETLVCTDGELIQEAFTHYQVRGDKSTVVAVGCKLLEEQLGPTMITALQGVQGMRFIVLERRNQFECLRSLAQVQLTGQWGKENAGTVELPRPHLDPVWCHQRMLRTRQFHGRLRSLPLPVEWVYYEDLCEDQDAVLTRLWAFLDVDSPGTVTSPQHRQETRGLHESVENFFELWTSFRSSPYERMLMTPQATVCFPWRATPDRIPAHDRCMKFWVDHGFSVVEANSNPDRPFLCNQARNTAVRQADTDIVIVADADTLPAHIETVQRAVELVSANPSLVVWPHTRYRYIVAEAVDDEDLGEAEIVPQRVGELAAEHHNMSAGIVVLSRSTYWDLGGYDEHFTPGAWGYDDLAFHQCAETLTSTVRLDGLVYSFSHAVERDCTDDNPNKRRYECLYAPAIGRPRLMRRVVELVRRAGEGL